ncbi:hypothetical protein Y032_1274g3797 [Ancylostoma ceylanicum]|uniref:Uncharacterized protein n=1 Tax=Ancylostoma ceylanicum TaxID=53326 RepID=A0A016W6K1_9BILA|nr:hypothetical protein Y032_1274g3797 [Ancylostoma ceylanicum]
MHYRQTEGDKQLRYKGKEELGEPNRGEHALRQLRRKRERACTNYERKGNRRKLWGSNIEEDILQLDRRS